jgi:hypothetical protein
MRHDRRHLHPDVIPEGFSCKATPTSRTGRGNDEVEQVTSTAGQAMPKLAEPIRSRSCDVEDVQGHGAADHGKAGQDEDPASPRAAGHGQASFSSPGPTAAHLALLRHSRPQAN